MPSNLNLAVQSEGALICRASFLFYEIEWSCMIEFKGETH